ncbi:MAG TPA: hypothetical protein VFR93_02700 [Candidatus Limnocylindrales bacterium]|nr:hypothetical protein [Candidatus Limnocylindrales bacterium]
MRDDGGTIGIYALLSLIVLVGVGLIVRRQFVLAAGWLGIAVALWLDRLGPARGTWIELPLLGFGLAAVVYWLGGRGSSGTGRWGTGP